MIIICYTFILFPTLIECKLLWTGPYFNCHIPSQLTSTVTGSEQADQPYTLLLISTFTQRFWISSTAMSALWSIGNPEGAGRTISRMSSSSHILRCLPSQASRPPAMAAMSSFRKARCSLPRLLGAPGVPEARNCSDSRVQRSAVTPLRPPKRHCKVLSREYSLESG